MTYLIGWRSNMGGCVSATSTAVIPTAQMSHWWLYSLFLSAAATSGAIQYGVPMKGFRFNCRVTPGTATETIFHDNVSCLQLLIHTFIYQSLTQFDISSVCEQYVRTLQWRGSGGL